MGEKLSREGIPLRDYRWGVVAITVIPALLWGAVLILWRWTIRKEIPDTRRVPENAIIYLFHGDLFNQMILMDLFDRFTRAGGWILGSHSFLSYFWSAESLIRRWKCFRYRRIKGESLRDRVIQFIKRPEVKTFRLATDSGGPYGTVRGSLVEMSLQTQRPLVGIRALASACITVRGHQLPLPFSRVKALISEPITPQTLARLSREDARLLLQRTMDQMADISA